MRLTRQEICRGKQARFRIHPSNRQSDAQTEIWRRTELESLRHPLLQRTSPRFAIRILSNSLPSAAAAAVCSRSGLSEPYSRCWASSDRINQRTMCRTVLPRHHSSQQPSEAPAQSGAAQRSAGWQSKDHQRSNETPEKRSREQRQQARLTELKARREAASRRAWVREARISQKLIAALPPQNQNASAEATSVQSQKNVLQDLPRPLQLDKFSFARRLRGNLPSRLWYRNRLRFGWHEVVCCVSTRKRSR